MSLNINSNHPAPKHSRCKPILSALIQASRLSHQITATALIRTENKADFRYNNLFVSGSRPVWRRNRKDPL